MTGFFEIAGIRAKAKTVTAARGRVEEKIETILAQNAGDYNPVLVKAETHGILVFRRPDIGWTYDIFDWTVGAVTRKFIIPSVMASWTRDEAERAGRRHLAQLLYDPRTGVTGEGVIADEVDRREHLGWVSWQRKYAEATKRGACDDEARLVAGGMKPMPEPRASCGPSAHGCACKTKTPAATTPGGG